MLLLDAPGIVRGSRRAIGEASETKARSSEGACFVLRVAPEMESLCLIEVRAAPFCSGAGKHLSPKTAYPQSAVRVRIAVIMTTLRV